MSLRRGLSSKRSTLRNSSLRAVGGQWEERLTLVEEEETSISTARYTLGFVEEEKARAYRFCNEAATFLAVFLVTCRMLLSPFVDGVIFRR
jgi:hypothetical protein